MFRTLALVCLVAVVGVSAEWGAGLKVRFDINVFGWGKSSFIELPRSETAAVEKGWTPKERPDGPAEYASLVMWCPKDDLTVCVLLDDTGYIAGTQISINHKEHAKPLFDWPAQGFTQWTTEIDGEPENYWSIQQYYLSAETLASDSATRMALPARKSGKVLQDNAVYVSGFNGEVYAISTNITVIGSADSDFTKQGCLPGMGQHYYYKTHVDSECKVDTLFPWFPLFNSNELVALGFVTFGEHTVPKGRTDWFESPPKAAVKMIVPDGPQCLYDLADSPGLMTMHTYFVDAPYKIWCPLW